MASSTRTQSWQKEFDGIANNEYFYALDFPTEIHHLDYFKFCLPQSFDQNALHRRWLCLILPKLKSSKIQQVLDQYGRLTREWQNQTVETERYWDRLAEEEGNAMEQRLDRKHHLSLQSNAVDQLDAQFQRYTKKVRNSFDVSPELPKTLHKVASPSTLGECSFSTGLSGSPARPEQTSSSPTVINRVLFSSPKRPVCTDQPARQIPFVPSPDAAASDIKNDEGARVYLGVSRQPLQCNTSDPGKPLPELQRICY